MPDDPNNPSPQNQEGTPPPNPGTTPDPQAIDPNDPRLRELITAEANRIAGERTAQLEHDIAEIRRTASVNQPPQPRNPEFVPPNKDEFWSDPAKSTAAIVEHLLQKTTAPLTELAQGIKKESEYTRLKKLFSRDPINARIIAKCEGQLDQMVGANPTEQNMTAALLALTGAVARGGIPGVTMADITGTTASPPPTPANEPPNGRIAPSAPPGPNNNLNQPSRALTEFEKKLARQKGWTDQQYIDMMDKDEMTLAEMNKALTPPQGANNG